MKKVVVCLVAIAFVVSAAMAGEKAPVPAKENTAKGMKKAPAEPQEMKEVTLTGKLTKTEKKVGEGDKEKTIVSYCLVGASGEKTQLPTPKGENAVSLDSLVDKDVELAVKITETEIGDKKIVRVREIVSAKAVEAAPVKEDPAEAIE